MSRLRRVVVCVGGGYRVDSRAGYPSVSLVTKLAKVRVSSGDDQRLSSLCKLIERGGRLAYRVTGTDRVHPFGLIWYVNN